MPHMIPPHPAPDAPDSERRLFAELARQLPATWTVFHAPDPSQSGREVFATRSEARRDPP